MRDFYCILFVYFHTEVEFKLIEQLFSDNMKVEINAKYNLLNAFIKKKSFIIGLEHDLENEQKTNARCIR